MTTYKDKDLIEIINIIYSISLLDPQIKYDDIKMLIKDNKNNFNNINTLLKDDKRFEI